MKHFFQVFLVVFFGLAVFISLTPFFRYPPLTASFIASKSAIVYIPAEPIYRDGVIPLLCNLLLTPSDDVFNIWAISLIDSKSIDTILYRHPTSNQEKNVPKAGFWYFEVCHFDPYNCVIMTQCWVSGTMKISKKRANFREFSENLGKILDRGPGRDYSIIIVPMLELWNYDKWQRGNRKPKGLYRGQRRFYERRTEKFQGMA